MLSLLPSLIQKLKAARGALANRQDGRDRDCFRPSAISERMLSGDGGHGAVTALRTKKVRASLLLGMLVQFFGLHGFYCPSS
jgi:hypothetical protein